MRGLPGASIARIRQVGFVCPSCREHRRYATAVTRNPPKPPASGFAALPSRRVISVSGPDAAKYLQGVITSSIATPEARPRTAGFYTAFLSAQGRVLHDVFVFPDTIIAGKDAGPDGLKENFLIEVDANEAERLEKHIRRYKLRAKFDVRLLPPSEVSVWHLWDDFAPGSLESDLARVVGSSILLRDPRAPGLGLRLLQAGDKLPSAELEQRSEDAYRIRRYLRGVPEGQDEIVREHALPLESNMDIMNGIDFHKGCYVGQELTIRTKHRGVVRKRILPCVIYDKKRAAPASLQYQSGEEEQDHGPESLTADMIPRDTSIGRFGKKGRSAGKWLKGVGNIGLALCRLEIMTDIALPGETASAAFSREDEFLLDWAGDGETSGNASSAKVKAFVPDWLREGLAHGAQTAS